MRDLSVVVVNYNGITTVLETIASVYRLEGVRPFIVMVDDGSSDGSVAAVKERFPSVEIFAEPTNTRDVNRLRNVGLRRAGTDYVLLTDNDVTFDPRFAVEMLGVIEADDAVAACLPRIMFAEDESRIYFAGGRFHFIATAVRVNPETADAASRTRMTTGEPYPAVGGGIGLFDRSKLERVGFFDEGYALAWGDDGELHQRFLLAGYRCLYVPRAICFHEHKPFDKSRRYRARGQVRNRWRFILTHHSLRTLVLIAPALAFYELVQAGYYLLKGIPHLYVLGTIDAIRRLPADLRRKKVVQRLRAVPDRDLLVAGPIYLRAGEGPFAAAVSAAVAAVGAILSTYWRIVRPLLARANRSPAGRAEASTPVAERESHLH